MPALPEALTCVLGLLSQGRGPGQGLPPWAQQAPDLGPTQTVLCCAASATSEEGPGLHEEWTQDRLWLGVADP